MDFPKFIGAVAILAAVVYVYYHLPDFSTSFGQLYGSLHGEVYHSASGNVSAAAYNFDQAAGISSNGGYINDTSRAGYYLMPTSTDNSFRLGQPKP